ncbi:MAG: hypothetical protein AB7T27_02115 [Kiritimatiellia bacterium]
MNFQQFPGIKPQIQFRQGHEQRFRFGGWFLIAGLINQCGIRIEKPEFAGGLPHGHREDCGSIADYRNKQIPHGKRPEFLEVNDQFIDGLIGSGAVIQPAFEISNIGDDLLSTCDNRSRRNHLCKGVCQCDQDKAQGKSDKNSKISLAFLLLVWFFSHFLFSPV